MCACCDDQVANDGEAVPRGAAPVGSKPLVVTTNAAVAQKAIVKANLPPGTISLCQLRATTRELGTATTGRTMPRIERLRFVGGVAAKAPESMAAPDLVDDAIRRLQEATQQYCAEFGDALDSAALDAHTKKADEDVRLAEEAERQAHRVHKRTVQALETARTMRDSVCEGQAAIKRRLRVVSRFKDAIGAHQRMPGVQVRMPATRSTHQVF